MPQRASATVSGSLQPARWNGESGGVLAIDVAGELTINGALDASGRGFRGGGAVDQPADPNTPVTDYRRARTDSRRAGTEGEGTAGTPRYVYDSVLNTTVDRGLDGYRNGDFNRGAPGNAGGGGDRRNAGGGGGGNGGVGGQGGNDRFRPAVARRGDPVASVATIFSTNDATGYVSSGLLGRVVLGGGRRRR